ncbi:MAG: tetratricopeptide repeat protein, partial [Proteobacteria bacterium]|nr:tetratricopeptide repeat protein [Pseudomonadota bacterium]
MAEESFKRKLTAILSADVKGYSRLMRQDEEATVRTLTAYREVIGTIIEKHRGRVVDSPGDNLLAEFVSVVDAVRSAVEIQEELKARNAELPEDRKMEFRIGVNLGDVIEEGKRIYGDGVNIAARVEGLAEGGGICISGTVYDQVKSKLALEYEYVGEHTVKGISEPVRVYRLRREIETAIPELSGELELPKKPSIAVLPFNNMSGDAQQEYIADGITENIIAALSKVSEMFVIARNSVFTYKGRPVKVQQVSQELGVRYVLEGSIQKAGDRVRITGQLVDATTGHHLWAEQYDRDITDFFDLLDEITREIVIALQVELTAGEQARLAQTHSLKAWGYFVRGVSLLERFAQGDNAKARDLFERAVEIDPDYSSAWTMLAWTHFNDARWGWIDSPAKPLEQAVELAQKAVALDDTQPVAHALLGNIYLFQKKHDQAIAEGKKAVALGPNSADTHALVAEILRFSGMFEEATTLCKRAMRLQPYYPEWYLISLALSYYYLGRYEDAIAAAEKGLQIAQDRGGGDFVWGSHQVFAMNYVRLGREGEARAHAEKVLELNPDWSFEWDRKW